MSEAKRRLVELLDDRELRTVLETWAASRAMDAQDQAVTELSRRDPSLTVAVQKAAASKTYEGLIGELQNFLKEKLT